MTVEQEQHQGDDNHGTSFCEEFAETEIFDENAERDGTDDEPHNLYAVKRQEPKYGFVACLEIEFPVKDEAGEDADVKCYGVGDLVLYDHAQQIEYSAF